MITSAHEFVRGVHAHAGGDEQQVACVVPIVLSAIGPYLGPAERGLLAEELPAPLDTVVARSTDLATPVEERVVAIGVKVGRARELIASVCRILADNLSTEALDVLARSLPPDLAALFAPGSTGARQHPKRSSTTLAEGRAGGPSRS